MAKLKHLLSKYLIKIIPIEETYFIKTQIPDIKLNKDIVLLNYGSLSPFTNGDAVFYKDKKNLYMWFTKNKIDSKKIYIPEGFLVYKTHKKQNNSIIIKNIQKNNQGIVIIRDGVLIAQFCKRNLENEYIELLKKEYSLTNPEIIRADNSQEYEVNIDDILKFSHSLNINMQSIITKTYEELKVPAIILLLLVNIFNISIYEYTNSMVSKKKTELRTIEQLNEKIKKQFGTLEKKSGFFKEFMNSELKYPNLYIILSAITSSVLKNKGKITLYRQSGNLIDMWVVSNSPSSIVNSLMSTGYFSSVDVISIAQFLDDRTKEVGHLELRMKAINYDR